jgi:hypothetical protein
MRDRPETQDDDLAPQSSDTDRQDAAVGAAARWSLIAAAVVGAIVGTTVWCLRSPGRPTTTASVGIDRSQGARGCRC